MRRTILTGVIVLGLCGPMGSLAQARISAPAATDTSTFKRAQARVLQASPFLDAPGNAYAIIDTRLLAQYSDPIAITKLEGQLASARDIIVKARDELRGLANDPLPGDGLEIKTANQVVADGAALSDDMLVMIDDMRAIVRALRQGDRAAMPKALKVLAASSTKMVQSQSITFRARAELAGEDTSEGHQLIAQASVYEGMAAAMRSMFEPATAASAARDIRRIETAMRAALHEGRIDLRAESSLGVHLKGASRDNFEQSQAWQAEIFASLDRSADALGAMAKRLEATAGQPVSLKSELTILAREESIQQDLVTKQVALPID